MPSPSGPPLDTELAERVLERFLRDETRRAGFSRLVIGLSGGIDSAVAALLAARAVGPENLIALAMPARESHPASLEHARLVAAHGGFAVHVVPIGDAGDALAGSLGPLDALRKGNVFARLRMTVLYDRSAAEAALVVGTSNKTELLLGYGTQHGDLASALNPLGDIYKCQVRALARRLGVPREVQEKPPSADLWTGQTDEGDLGFTYDQADAVLYRMVDLRTDPATIVAEGFDAALVDRIVRLVVRTQYKRRHPLIAKLSNRTVGWEFRYPRDWRT